MKSLVSYIINAMLPMFYLFFVISGFTAALVSGIIEYVIFKNLFPPESNIVLYVIIPILLVIVFETTKMFLVFYRDQYNNKDSSVSILSFLRPVLITISVICTLIFSFNKLYNPGEKNYKDEMIKNYKKSYLDNKTKIKSEINYWKSVMDSERKTGIGPRYRNAQEHFNTLSQKLEELNQSYIKEKNSLKLSRFSNRTTDQSFISSTLSSFSIILTNNENYSRRKYLMFITLLSILISIGLESIIIATFKVLSHDFKDAFKFDNQEIEITKVVQNIFPKLIPGTFIFFSLLFFKVTHIKSFLMVIFIGALIGFFMSFFLKSFQKGISKKTIKEGIITALIGSFVPLIIGIFVGSLMDLNSIVASPFALGISIGAGFMGQVAGESYTHSV